MNAGDGVNHLRGMNAQVREPRNTRLGARVERAQHQRPAGRD
jgi:hypothetical protein